MIKRQIIMEKLVRVPFDLELAKKITNGECDGRIVTRDGKNARVVCWDNFPIVALISGDGGVESCEYYLDNGKWEKYEDHHLDLMLEIPEYMTFKDGDVISNGNGFVFILNGSGKLRTSLYVAVYPDGNITFGGAAHGNEIHLSKLVTETEKQKLIDKLKSSKKPKAKEYLKRFFGIEVKQEYEFKPFDKVLVRKDDNDFWRADFFSNMEDGKYCCVGYFWEQCIPYKGNEHLLGTTEKPE